MKLTHLITLTVALLAFWLPASSQNPPPITSQPWPPDLTSLLDQPYGGGWNPPLRFVEPAGQIGGTTKFVLVQDNVAYIAHGPRLQIVNVANPASPVVLGRPRRSQLCCLASRSPAPSPTSHWAKAACTSSTSLTPPRLCFWNLRCLRCSTPSGRRGRSGLRCRRGHRPGDRRRIQSGRAGAVERARHTRQRN